MTSHRLYYIVQSEMLDGGVIEAQVVARLRAQSELTGGLPTKLVFLEPARVAFSAKARSTLRAYRRMWPDGDIAVVPFVSRLGASSPGHALAVYLARERFTSANPVFHCRGASATWSADIGRRFLGRGRVIYDLRGAAAYEAIHRMGSSWADHLSAAAERAFNVTLSEERRGAATADFMLTVSPQLKQYAIDVLGAAADRISIVPSCVSPRSFNRTTRQRIRQEWQVPDSAPVFIYAGRIGPERLPAHMLRVFGAALRLNVDAKLVLLLYRDDLSDLDVRLAAAGIPQNRVIRGACSRDEVTAQLCGADIGFIFYEPALRFRYGFPIKFPEYLAAGLSVIANSFAYEIPDLVKSRQVGWVLDHDTDDTTLHAAVRALLQDFMAHRDAARTRAIECCSDLYLWHQHVDAVRHAYGLGEAEPAMVPIVASTQL